MKTVFSVAVIAILVSVAGACTRRMITPPTGQAQTDGSGGRLTNESTTRPALNQNEPRDRKSPEPKIAE